jgi:uncharacterized protein
MQSVARLFQVGVLSTVLWLAILFPALALEVPATPTDVPVVDQTNTLTREQIASLSAIIAAERTENGNQLGLLIISTLQDEAIEDYAVKVARTWGIGEKDKDNGALVLVVKNDRLIRIEVGYGLEGELTDAASSRIIRNIITPQFREGRYFEGLDAGLREIVGTIHGEGSAGQSTPANPLETVASFFPFFFVIPVWLSSVLGRTRSWWAGGVIGAVAGLVTSLFVGFFMTGVFFTIGLAVAGLILDWFVSRNFKQHAQSGTAPSWWAGGNSVGGFGGFGGGNSDNDSGGFGGFGGGGFGGGGADGKW